MTTENRGMLSQLYEADIFQGQGSGLLEYGINVVQDHAAQRDGGKWRFWFSFALALCT